MYSKGQSNKKYNFSRERERDTYFTWRPLSIAVFRKKKKYSSCKPQRLICRIKKHPWKAAITIKAQFAS